MLGIACRYVVPAGNSALHHFSHQRLDQLAAVGIGHQRCGARPQQNRETVVRDIPDQFLPTRLMQIRHGLGIEAGAAKQPDALLDNCAACRPIGGTAVITHMDRAQRLMGNDTRRLAMDADVAEPSKHMQRIGEQRAQAVFDVQAVLQQQYLGVRCRRLQDGRCQVGVAGGFRAHQQPIAGWHVLRVRIGLHRVQRQYTVGRAIDSQAMLGHRGELAAQQKMHIKTGTCQHHPVETADCAGPDNADRRLGNCPHHGNSSAVRLSAWCTARLSSVPVRRDFSAPKNSPSRTTNSAGK
ncbi:hypothetical protein D9M69_458080 [compost metagenome]